MSSFWLDKHLTQWQSAIANDHKPQAVIVSGQAGMGKHEFLNVVVANLMCRKVTDGHCGNCQNCTLQKQNHHPDVQLVEPDKNVIKVKMIRELTEFFTSTPHCSDYKIAVINQADCMNVAAANALLKVLEEPPSRGILFLVTAHKHQLMPTIRSRCIAIDIAVNQTEKAALPAWLQQNSGVSAEHSVQDALLLSDYQPKTALNLLAEKHLLDFEGYIDELYAAFTAQKPVTQVAKYLLENMHSTSWPLLQRYYLQLAKSVLGQKSHEVLPDHPLNLLIKKSPKVVHIIMKVTELTQLFMLNLQTQIKAQLLLEAMLLEIKSELNQRS